MQLCLHSRLYQRLSCLCRGYPSNSTSPVFASETPSKIPLSTKIHSNPPGAWCNSTLSSSQAQSETPLSTAIHTRHHGYSSTPTLPAFETLSKTPSSTNIHPHFHGYRSNSTPPAFEKPSKIPSSTYSHPIYRGHSSISTPPALEAPSETPVSNGHPAQAESCQRSDPSPKLMYSLDVLRLDPCESSLIHLSSSMAFARETDAPRADVNDGACSARSVEERNPLRHMCPLCFM